MKILMFGRGVIATIHGWALERGGHDIEFYYVRRGRTAAYGEAIELDLLDARRRVWGQRVVQHWPVRLREALEPGRGEGRRATYARHYWLAATFCRSSKRAASTYNDTGGAVLPFRGAHLADGSRARLASPSLRAGA